jgi:hypothetical protein
MIMNPMWFKAMKELGIKIANVDMSLKHKCMRCSTIYSRFLLFI